MKTTIELAREAGASTYTNRHFIDRPFHTFSPEQLETYAALLRAEWEAERVQQKPVASQSRFVGYEWAECSIEHARMVLESPQEWTNYEVRLLYTAPPAQPATTSRSKE